MKKTLLIALAVIVAAMFVTPSITVSAKSNAKAAVQQKNRTVSGVVKDLNGQPVVGASIRVKDTSIGTVTDAEGRFSLQVPEGCTELIISFIGYKPVIVKIPAAGNVTVGMEEDEPSFE